MVNIVSVVSQRNARSLVLFDELGAGTDPIEGAALAIAVIEDVRAAGDMCIATTHYTELKTYALDTAGVCNASCEFDVETLRPTYKLIIGTPGKSNAFAISAKLGLPSAIVERANELVSAENKRLDSVLGELEALRIETEKQLDEAQKMKAEYEAFKRDAEAEIEKKQREAEKAVESARAKAQNMVESAKLSSDFIMEQLDRLQKQRDSEKLGEELERARREIRENLRTGSKSFDPVETRKIENYKLPRALRKGDEVYVVTLDKTGYLLEDPDRSGKVMAQIGIIKSKVRVSDLQLVEEETKISKGGKTQKLSQVRVSVSRDFKGEVDLRGMTGDEAWSVVDKYFDDAAIAGFHTVRLIHGKGTGALKNALWAYLRRDSRVASFRIGQFGEGDGGVSVVELK
jgi:DNA mismatch repair protein MutS2